MQIRVSPMKPCRSIALIIGFALASYSMAGEPKSPPPVRSEKEIVAQIAGEKLPADADPRFVAAVRRIKELGGKLEFDAAGDLVGVDLSSDRVSVADADIPQLLALSHLRELKLSGGGITNAGHAPSLLDRRADRSRAPGRPNRRCRRGRTSATEESHLAEHPPQSRTDRQGVGILEAAVQAHQPGPARSRHHRSGTGIAQRNAATPPARSSRLLANRQAGLAAASHAEEPQGVAARRLPDRR